MADWRCDEEDRRREKCGEGRVMPHAPHRVLPRHRLGAWKYVNIVGGHTEYWHPVDSNKWHKRRTEEATREACHPYRSVVRA